jgi:hypothetical protein
LVLVAMVQHSAQKEVAAQIPFFPQLHLMVVEEVVLGLRQIEMELPEVLVVVAVQQTV